MNVGIIGGGSIGLLFSSYLAEKFEVNLYTKTNEQASLINENGIQLVKNGLIKNSRSLNAYPIDQWTGAEDLTIIAVKQYDLSILVKDLLFKQSSKTSFLFLQNGMGHLSLLENINAESIFVSSVEHGAYKKNSYTVEHNGDGITKMAVYKGKLTLPTTFFNIPEFPIVFETNYYEMLLKKLVVNAVINPLTAVLKVENGEIIQNKHYFMAVNNLFNEIVEVLNLQNPNFYFELINSICKKTAKNRSSMLKDIELNRPTEIDAIIGYILEEAEKRNMNAPICQTLYYLIKGSE